MGPLLEERPIDAALSSGRPGAVTLTTVAPVVGLPAGAAPSALRPGSRRGAVARRLRNWDLRGDTSQVHANVTLVDGLLTPRPGLGAFARRHVLLPASYLTVGLRGRARCLRGSVFLTRLA